MGGFGSGTRWSKKAVVDSKYCLDISDLKRWKMLTPGITDRSGRFQWTRGASKTRAAEVGYVLTIGPMTGTLRLRYRFPDADADLDYPIPLVTTRCHLGGVRWWFVCPLSRNGIPCRRRVRKLYLSGQYFGCRACHRLTYTSCQESDSRVYALLRVGLHAMGDRSRMSVTELGLALEALTIQQKRFDRLLGI